MIVLTDKHASYLKSSIENLLDGKAAMESFEEDSPGNRAGKVLFYAAEAAIKGMIGNTPVMFKAELSGKTYCIRLDTRSNSLIIDEAVVL